MTAVAAFEAQSTGYLRWGPSTGASVPVVGDELLSARLCAGDDSAIAEVFDRHGALVLGLARRITGSQAMAEDVVQEVFTSLWTHPHRFDPDRGSLRSYLGLMAERRAIDLLRSSSRRLARDIRATSIEPASGACDHADATATSEMVRQAITRLPGDQRRAVELAFLHGMTYREVALSLGVPEGTVKSRLRLAQSKLREWLTPLTADAT